MSAPASASLQNEGLRLRERNAALPAKVDAYSSSSSDDEAEAAKDIDKEKKTFGRTPDGTGSLPMRRRCPAGDANLLQ